MTGIGRGAECTPGMTCPGRTSSAPTKASERYLDERWATDRDMDTDEQVEVLLRCLDIVPEPGLVEAVAGPYANAVLHVEPFLVDGTLEALDRIRDSGLRLALISNTGRTPGAAMRKVIGKMGLLDYFEVTTFSNEAGYLKPHPRIFEMTLSRMGAKPGQTVHVGDHDVLDVQGAKAYGMKSVRVLQYAGEKGMTCEPTPASATMDRVPTPFSASWDNFYNGALNCTA